MRVRKNINNRVTYIYQARRGRKRYDAQLATAYILYMMLGSAFKKCVFASAAMEERLKFEYMKMPLEEQYETEEKIIEWMNGELALTRYEGMWSKVFTYQEERNIGICFETYFGAIEILIDGKGNAFQRQRK